jgi:uncharacterized damage-inducible protein DinB
MTTLSDQSRRLIAFNQWADERILDAAAGLSPERFAELSDQFAHLLGTLLFWNAKWRHRDTLIREIIATAMDSTASVSELRTAFAQEHVQSFEFGASLQDESWDQAESWWAEFGIEEALSVGETITLLVDHGTQHRSEIAVITSLQGCSPGDIDYMAFRVTFG